MMRHLWTAAEVERLTALYPDTRSEAVAATLGCTVGQVYTKASAIGLKKSAEYLASALACRLRRGDNVGAGFRFQKGAQPWNKGIKFDSGGRSHETRFKPGQVPHTWKPVGSERFSKEGYLERKMTDTGVTRHDFVQVHRLVWIEHNGPIPAGHAIAFKDGDKTHIAIDNLELLTRAQLMARNTIHNYPKEIAELVQLRGAITRQINKRERKTT